MSIFDKANLKILESQENTAINIARSLLLKLEKAKSDFANAKDIVDSCENDIKEFDKLWNLDKSKAIKKYANPNSMSGLYGTNSDLSDF